MARDCKPPIYDSDAKSCVKSAFGTKTSRLSYQRIANVLMVTPEEAKELSGLTRKPFPRSGAQPEAVAAKPAKPTPDARRQTILRIIQCRGGAAPSLREMQTLLADARYTVSYVTVRSDYKALGIVNANITARNIRADRKAQQPSLLELVEMEIAC